MFVMALGCSIFSHMCLPVAALFIIVCLLVPGLPKFTRQNISRVTEFSIKVHLETDDKSINRFIIGYVYAGSVYNGSVYNSGLEIPGTEWEIKTVNINKLDERYSKVEINELKSASVYALAVRMANDVGSSSWSTAVRVETQGSNDSLSLQ